MRNFKRFICMGLMCTCITLFLGCSDDGGSEEDTTKKIESIADNGISNVEKPVGVKVVSDVSAFKKVSEDQSFNIEIDDSQTVRGEYGIAQGRETYYFIENYYLYFYEKATGEHRIACNKPDCTHNDVTVKCNALLDTNDYNAITYYEGDIYYVEKKGNEFALYKKSVEEGTTQKILDIMNVQEKANSDAHMQIHWIIHRGYIYYIGHFGSGMTEDSYYLNDSNCLMRWGLDGKSEPEVLMALPAEAMLDNPHLTNMQASGSYIYFGSPYYDEECSSLISSIYRYNIEAGQIEKLDVGKIDPYSYIVSGNYVYYKKVDCADKLFVYVADSNVSREFVSMDDGVRISSILPYQAGVMVSTDEYWCYDESGEREAVIKEIMEDSAFGNVTRELMLGGDDEYIFYQVEYTDDDGEHSGIVRYDISEGVYTLLK